MNISNNTESRYLNPMTDYGFKKIFGEKDIMIAFLTDLLCLESPIEDIIFIDKDVVAESEEMRGVIYDLRCKTVDGDEFIVEMQNKAQLNFSDRIVYYLSRSISSQQRKGGATWNFKLAPVYGIFFLNFHLNGMTQRAIRTIQLTVDETGEVFSQKLKAFTLELPEFKGKPTDYPKTKIEYWLYNLVNMEDMTTQLPFQDEQPIFMKLGGVSEYAHLNEQERREYDRSLDIYRTNLCVMEREHEVGYAEGHAEGVEMGEKRKGLAIAQKLKNMGLPIEQIAEATGLTADEIIGL